VGLQALAGVALSTSESTSDSALGGSKMVN